MSVAPMLATLGVAADIDEAEHRWAFEMKWDGIRAIATVRHGVAEFRTRNGIDVSATYPDLAELAGRLKKDATLDGEIVALNKLGRPDFGLLQRRMKLTRKADVAAAVRAIPVAYMVFDLLSLGDRSVQDVGYDERRSLLLTTVTDGGRIHIPEAFEGDLLAAMDASRRLGIEGIVAKKRDSTYAPGRRSAAWVKIKHHKTQEVIVGGWRPGSGRRADTIGSLLLGIPSPTGLEYVGRVGTGFDDADLDELSTTLRARENRASPFLSVPSDVARDAHWTTPTLIGEVEFAEWTASGKLRQPSWRGWRPDKQPRDVVREST